MTVNSAGAETLVRAAGVAKRFTFGSLLSRKVVQAVDDVSFTIAQGETLGLVGESGSGKSTLGRMVVGLIPPTAGHIRIAGQAVEAAKGAAKRRLWRTTQMVFQDPYSSLNPKMTVGDALAEPLRNFGIARGEEANRLIRQVIDACGLSARALELYPREFSGGQRQRIGIARALILRPNFIVADEPVSALDVSIQAQIINLLQDLKAEYGLTYLFIAHDLAIVRHVSDRVAVMYRGRLVEVARSSELYARPLHPYTALLLNSIPIPDPKLERERRDRMAWTTSAAVAAPTAGGCPFAPRCPRAQFPICGAEAPLLVDKGGGHFAACHFVGAPDDRVNITEH